MDRWKSVLKTILNVNLKYFHAILWPPEGTVSFESVHASIDLLTSPITTELSQKQLGFTGQPYHKVVVCV